jgi:UTP-glucose-1-phosphate uridylyltransferase
MNLTLAVLAAGIGSRYGGLKQMESVGPSGEFIVDYSVYDALRAGFNKVVFVIRKEIGTAFKSTIGARIEKQTRVEYVFQELSTALPTAFAVPSGRQKPWGTGHAVISCAGTIQEPFAVINADDFYGRESYAAVADFLTKPAGTDSLHCMAGYVLRNTVFEGGVVARGICRVSETGMLQKIIETTGIERKGAAIRCPGGKLTGDEMVSMNLWGFKPSFFGLLKPEWEQFLGTGACDPKAEFFLPTVVDNLITAGKMSVKAIENNGLWLGMTSREDRNLVSTGIANLITAGMYPRALWK